jgi:hypothetical protein
MSVTFMCRAKLRRWLEAKEAVKASIAIADSPLLKNRDWVSIISELEKKR